jgi:4-carboxymuconolactone decarboxylase
VLYRPEQLPAHLRMAIANGLTKSELSEAITHLAFYGGYPAAVSASGIAHETLGSLDEGA